MKNFIFKADANTTSKVKGSKFISYAFRIESEEQANSIIKEIKTEHPKANHHCFAWKLDEEQFRSSDDGEPSGTAGKPILGRLTSNALIYSLIVVVRYFGGTKLGVSGLIKAYKGAAELLIKETQLLEKLNYISYELEFPFELQNEIEYNLEKLDARIKSKEFLSNCKYSIDLNEEQSEQINILKNKYFSLQVTPS